MCFLMPGFNYDSRYVCVMNTITPKRYFRRNIHLVDTLYTIVIIHDTLYTVWSLYNWFSLGDLNTRNTRRKPVVFVITNLKSLKGVEWLKLSKSKRSCNVYENVKYKTISDRHNCYERVSLSSLFKSSQIFTR